MIYNYIHTTPKQWIMSSLNIVLQGSFTVCAFSRVTRELYGFRVHTSNDWCPMTQWQTVPQRPFTLSPDTNVESNFLKMDNSPLKPSTIYVQVKIL